MNASATTGDARADEFQPSVEDVRGTVHLLGRLPAYAGIHRHAEAYPPHRHAFLEISLVIDGSGTHRTRGTQVRLHPGDVVLVHPGEVHEYFDCTSLALYNCAVSSALLATELAWIRDDPALAPLLTAHQARIATETELDACVSALHDVRRRSLPGAGAMRAELIACLVLFLCRIARATGLTGSGRPDLPVLVRQVAQRLYERPAHPWTLRELADELHVSPYHLAHRFRDVMGEPPLTYLARCRAELAARLLATTDLPIGRVGVQVGWPDPTHFSRRFKARYGSTPSEYRRRYGVIG